MLSCHSHQCLPDHLASVGRMSRNVAAEKMTSSKQNGVINYTVLLISSWPSIETIFDSNIQILCAKHNTNYSKFL